MNEQEFANIVREHKSTIYTVCYMFSKNQDEVDDLFQEVLLNLWRGIEHFKGESKLATWIYRISLNTCISADRKRKSTSPKRSANRPTYMLRLTRPKRARYKCCTSGFTGSVLSTAPSCCYGSKDCPTTKSGPSLASRPKTCQCAWFASAKNSNK